MRRLPFIPARDPRHRVAALALYRALARSAGRIPLPDDIGSSRPLVRLVRRRFAKNAPDTSPRLVYAAMAAGYRFLTLFVKAQTPGSAEHVQVVAHLGARLESAAAARAAFVPAAPRPPSTPQGDPLITNIAPPGQPPQYVSSVLPRPQSTLTRPRRLPSLCATTYGQPFLRIKKPQPRALSRMVGRKDSIFRRKVQKIVEIDEDLVHEAALEDEWESLVAAQLKKELRTIECCNDVKATFSWTVQLARLWWELQIEKTWRDWTARGIALNRLVEEERKLAEQENGLLTGGHGPPDIHADRHPPLQSTRNLRPNISTYPGPMLPLLAAFEAAARDKSEVDDGKDPFISPSWAALIKAVQPRILKWIAGGAAARQGDGDSSLWTSLLRKDGRS